MAETLKSIPLSEIYPAEDNVRTTFTEIESLAKSINFIGLIEPIVVTKQFDGYRIVAGARRHQALKLLVKQRKMKASDPIKCIVRTGLAGDTTTAAMLIENMQRVDLSIIEEAEGVVRLAVEHSYSVAEIADSLGMSKGWVNQRVAIHALPPEVKMLVSSGEMSAGNAVMLAQLDKHRLDRLTKSGAVPSQYNIEDQVNKQRSEQVAAQLFKKLVKDGYLISTEKELKATLKKDIGDLSGMPFTLKSIFPGAETIIRQTWEHVDKDKPRVLLTRVANMGAKAANGELSKKIVYIMTSQGGYYEWYEASLLVPKAMRAQDAELTEEEKEDAIYDEIDQANEEIRKKHDEDCAHAAISFLANTKPAELTKRVLQFTIQEQVGSKFRASRLSYTLILLGLSSLTEGDDAAYEGNIETLLAYANKSGANLARAAAASVSVIAIRNNLEIPYPDPPKYKDYPEMEDVGF